LFANAAVCVHPAFCVGSMGWNELCHLETNVVGVVGCFGFVFGFFSSVYNMPVNTTLCVG